MDTPLNGIILQWNVLTYFEILWLRILALLSPPVLLLNASRLQGHLIALHEESLAVSVAPTLGYPSSQWLEKLCTRIPPPWEAWGGR